MLKVLESNSQSREKVPGNAFRKIFLSIFGWRAVQQCKKQNYEFRIPIIRVRQLKSVSTFFDLGLEKRTVESHSFSNLKVVLSVIASYLFASFSCFN